jgi:hypothetical protein
MTRRIFLQPEELLEVMSSDGTSCLKLELQEITNLHGITTSVVVLWPQPRTKITVGDINSQFDTEL